MDWDSDGGTTIDNLMILNGTASLNVTGDLTLDYSGGQLIKHTLNNSSTLSVDGNVEFIATGDGLTEVELNNTSSLILKRNFVRGSPAYGVLDCNDATTVSYAGDLFLQTFAQEAGSGTGDVFSYVNVTINNSRSTIPQVTMDGPIALNSTLTLTDGIVRSTSANLLTIGTAGSTGAGSATSYVWGPVKKIGDSNYTFPLGQNAI